MTIAPIPTRYKGYHFRSRLEARWAVFFDTLGIEWQYEAEGYVLRDGSRYLPDFYLPAQNLYIEIKAVAPNPDELSKCEAMYGLNNAIAAIFWGMPGEHVIGVYCTDSCDSGGGSGWWWGFPGGQVRLMFNQRTRGLTFGFMDLRGDRTWLRDDWTDDPALIGLNNDDMRAMDLLAMPITRAIEAARSARFEYGHSGAS